MNTTTLIISLIGILFAFAGILFNWKRKKIQIDIYPTTKNKIVNVSFNGFTRAQEKEISELIVFECLGIQTKIKDYENQS
jgi:hypothetical protein